MGFTYMRMSMLKNSFSSTCKVYIRITKKQFSEYLQGICVTILSSGEAESGLERLHQCAEKELQQFLNTESKLPNDFNDFRTKLAGLTRYLSCTKYC